MEIGDFRAGRMVIIIVPFGDIEFEVLDYLRNNLADLFQAEIAVEDGMLLPELAFDRRRSQYLAAPLVQLLYKRFKGRKQFILGVLDEDLYTPGLNFIFGQADAGKGIALISIQRLSPSFYGLPENKELLLERSFKEAVHEIGHLFHLGHCTNPRCVMYFSNNLSDTERKGNRFCHRCQILLN